MRCGAARLSREQDGGVICLESFCVGVRVAADLREVVRCSGRGAGMASAVCMGGHAE